MVCAVQNVILGKMKDLYKIKKVFTNHKEVKRNISKINIFHIYLF
jgi:hypothetical protein